MVHIFFLSFFVRCCNKDDLDYVNSSNASSNEESEEIFLPYVDDPHESTINKIDPVRRDLATPILPPTYAETVLHECGKPSLDVELKIMKRIFVEMDQLMLLFPKQCKSCGSIKVYNFPSVSHKKRS
jgi:hypothetical protein